MDIEENIDLALGAKVTLAGGATPTERKACLAAFAKEVAAPHLASKDGHMKTGSLLLFCVSIILALNVEKLCFATYIVGLSFECECQSKFFSKL